MMRTALVLLVVASLTTAMATPAEYAERQDAEVMFKENQERASLSSDEAVHLLLGGAVSSVQQMNSLQMPFIPMIAGGGISLSLTGLELLKEGNITLMDKNITRKSVSATVLVPMVSLLSDLYIAGGMINTLPFVGESTLNISIVDLMVTLSFGHSSLFNFCAIPNTTAFVVNMTRLVVKFEDMNPGTDTGDLANAFLSSISTDISKWITILLNGDILHPILDRLTVNILNKINSNNGLIPPYGACEAASKDAQKSGYEDSFNEDWLTLEKMDEIVQKIGRTLDLELN